MSIWPGSKQKSEMSSFMESISSTTTSVLNQQISNNSIRCEVLNNQNVRVGPTGRVIIGKGNFNISQRANVTSCDLVSSITNDANNELTTKIKAAIESTMDQKLKSISGFAATSFNDQESKTKFQSIMRNAISTSINNTSISNCAVSVSVVDNQTVEINGTVEIGEGDYNISQEAIIASTAKCMTKNIISNINVSEVDSLLKSSQKTSLYTEARGFFESLGSMGWILIAIAVVVVLGGMVVAAMKMKGNGSPTTTPMTPMTPQFYPQMMPQYNQQMYR